MAMLSFIVCLFNHHSPDRRDVSWDGRAYIGHCRHCGVPIKRHGRRIWRKRKRSGHQDCTRPQTPA